jgi:hypothetical protein
MRSFFVTFLLLSSFSLFAQVTFTDVAPSMGIDDAGNGQGVSSIDFNNDGYLDIYLVNNSSSNYLWMNNGGTGFTDVSSVFGVNNNGSGRGCAIGDFNNDGWVDIVVANFTQSAILYRNDSVTFTNVAAGAGMGLTTWGGSINWFDYNNDSYLDCFIGNDGIPSHTNYLFRNDDLVTFTEVAAGAGLTDNLSTLCAATADYDNDGDLDLFCGNQTGSPTNVLYRNDGGSFTDVTISSGLLTYSYTWGADWGDYDNDGNLDLYIANSNAANQFFRNNGDGTFTEMAASLGIDDASQSFSTGWADYDNDGDLDLYVANGTGTDKLYQNNGSSFTDVAASAGTDDSRLSNSTTWADFNNDGFPDLYLSNNGVPNRLYMNNAENTNHWLELKLIGTTTNRSAIGARVRIVTGGISQIREVQGGSGHNGQNSLPVEFGLGSAAMVDSIIIKWPGGTVDYNSGIVANQIISVTEGQPIVPVELTDFTAEELNSGIKLKWTTATETNNRGFEIEKAFSSRNTNYEWKVIGFVKGYGTSTINQTYSFTDRNPNPGIYHYRLKQYDFDGRFSYSKELEVDFSGVTGFNLSQNYPNPFNPVTIISYSLPAETFVTLKIFDVMGNDVKTLVKEKKPAGNHRVNFYAGNLAAGLYLYQLRANDFVATKKMMLLK